MSFRGKIVDKWDLDVANTPYKVALRMRTDHSYGDTKTQFFVTLANGEELAAEDGDVDKLRKRVKERLGELDSTQWDAVFFVEVRGGLKPIKPKEDDDDDDAEAPNYGRRFEESLDVAWQKYEVGTKPDGSKCYREIDGRGWTQDGELEDGLEHYRDMDFDQHSPTMRAVIPASPANEIALVSIQHAIALLAEKVKDLMGPGKIQKTLTQSVGRLLSVPEVPEKKEGARA